MELKTDVTGLSIAGALTIALQAAFPRKVLKRSWSSSTTVTQADADYYNNKWWRVPASPAGATVYRVYVDMAPGYKLSNVPRSPSRTSSVLAQPPDVTTTTTF
ncbi:MAG: hypothetical protein H6597_00310 [Flavobacteriales bacterium]|nr:hypothetical protein [Flavobacteriales bacterium]